MIAVDVGIADLAGMHGLPARLAFRVAVQVESDETFDAGDIVAR